LHQGGQALNPINKEFCLADASQTELDCMDEEFALQILQTWSLLIWTMKLFPRCFPKEEFARMIPNATSQRQNPLLPSSPREKVEKKAEKTEKQQRGCNSWEADSRP
jgi:hypothetical protein